MEKVWFGQAFGEPAWNGDVLAHSILIIFPLILHTIITEQILVFLVNVNECQMLVFGRWLHIFIHQKYGTSKQ